MNLLTCQNVSFAYENQIVIQNLDLAVKQGDYLCVVGENGTGKTTLIKGLLGLKKPANGSIIMGDDFKHSEIGYLPQQTEAQKDFPASVWEIVLSGCLNRRGMRVGYSKEDKKRAMETMKLLGIAERKNQSYRELSGGYQQRALLARALLATSKMILLDEPVTGLDPVAASEFYDAIRALNEERNITVIMVSHDLEEALGQAKHILHLTNESYFVGTVSEYRDSKIGKIFLGGKTHVE